MLGHWMVRKSLLLNIVFLIAIHSTLGLSAAPVVPGTGIKQDKVSDDFEDAQWKYYPNLPKSSREQDERERRPWGYSANRMLIEGPHRGTPDFLQRLLTPEGGLSDSQGALLIRTMRSGVPGRLSYSAQQDDLMMNVYRKLGSTPVSRSPNCVVRVYVPPFDKWENRTGTSFAMRISLRGDGRGKSAEPYWPGMFFNFRSKTSRRYKEDSAHFIIRAKNSGQDYTGPSIEPGWWTLGMSVTPDGKVHYFARPGVEDLTPKDHIASHYCYGFRARYFKTFFFNVVNRDDGRTWSTSWIIDDPTLYLMPKGGRRIATRQKK